MEKQLFSDVSPEKRANILRDNADNVELHSYFKQFNNDELIDLRKTLSEKLIQISDKEIELNEIKEDFKAVLNPLKKDSKKTLDCLKNKGEIVKENCYIIFDETMENAAYYNQYGRLVDHRKTDENERQKTIKMKFKDGTND